MISSQRDAFKPLTNQNTEDNYRQADILLWHSEGEVVRRIEAKMKHVYDSFTFHINIKWDLTPIDKELVYQPMQETLRNFKIEFTPDEGEKIILFDNDHEIDDNDETQNLMYRAEDGTYRYLLTSGQGGKITWQYTYRHITFRGERIIPAKSLGKRYIHHEKADMGELPGPHMQISDFYCSKDTLGENIGYVFPWDAAFRINETDENYEKPFAGHHCIGLVVGVGKHENDISDYTQSRIPDINGYVMALTDTSDELAWATTNSTGVKKFVGTISYLVPTPSGGIINKAFVDWSGFYNFCKIKEFVEANKSTVKLTDFPAAYACETYGDDYGLSAPDNTVGWFLPTIGMYEIFLKGLTDKIETTGLFYEKGKLWEERFDTIKEYLRFDTLYPTDIYAASIKGYDSQYRYWPSNEHATAVSQGLVVNSLGVNQVNKYNKNSIFNNVNYSFTVRPFLAF